MRQAAAVLEAARATRGFMPDEEGMALSRLAALVDRSERRPPRPVIIEIGAYCGRSTLYLLAGLLGTGDIAPTRQAAVDALPSGGEESADGRTILFSVDHHRGSEENQKGWEHHDPSLVDPATGRMETLPYWRAAVESAGVADLVVAVVGDSPTVAARWSTPAELVFIDGGHGDGPAWADYFGWAPLVATGGYLAIHDVFSDPALGGRPPYELYRRATSCGAFADQTELGCGSLRVLQRTGAGC